MKVQDVFYLLIIFFKRALGREYHSLGIHATDHCNLNCCSCSNYSPIADKFFLKADSLYGDLKNLERVKSFFSMINVGGGEPLLNPEINQILKLLRDFFPDQKISLITNGILLKKMEMKFWECISDNNIIVKISKYPNINYEDIESYLKMNNYRYEIFGDRNNGWTRFLFSNKHKNKFLNFYFKCENNKFCWQLRDGKIIVCPICAYIDIFNKKFGTDFKLHSTDFIKLDKKITKYNLTKFALTPKHFCKYCVFPREIISWRQSDNSIHEWYVDG